MNVSEPTRQQQKLPASELILSVLGSIALIAAAIFASFLGRFLSYGGLETTLSAAAFNALMFLAVYGPFLITVSLLLWALYRLGTGRRASWITALGIVALIVNYNVVGNAMTL